VREDPYDSLFALAAAFDHRRTDGTIGDETAPSREPLKFSNEHALRFIDSAARVVGDPGAPRVEIETALFGLLGSIGPLPYFYSEVVARTERENETALRDFLAILSHRATSLMYRAWRKSRLNLEEHSGASRSLQHKYRNLIAGLVGAADMPQRIAWLDMQGGTPLAAPDLFTRRVRSARGLQQLLQRQFGVRVEIEEFVGAWEELPDDVRSALGGPRPPGLGRTSLLGRRVWQVQSTIGIVVKYPDRQQYARLKPDSESLRRIQLAVRMYCTADLAFRLRIVVSGKTLPSGTLGGGEGGAMLGWNTLAGSPRPDQDYVFSICRDYNAKRMNR
jgi:type VI secretion system protein ImpH